MEKKNVLYMVLPTVLVLAVLAITVTVGLMLKGGEKSYRSIRVVELKGEVAIDREDVGSLEVSVNMNLISGDRISTSEDAYVVLRLDEDKYVMLGEQGAIQILASGNAADGRTQIHLETGIIVNDIQNSLSQNSAYEIVIPGAAMSVRGTVFEVRWNPNNSTGELLTYEGSVALTLQGKEPVQYSHGKYAQFQAGDTPQFLIERETITDERMDLRMIPFLYQISESGRELDFGEANFEELIKRDREEGLLNEREAVIYLTKESYYVDGELQYAREYEYDTFGNQVKYTWYEQGGSIGIWSESQYDADGNVTEIIWYSSDGSVVGRTVNEYDVEGHLQKAVSYSAEGAVQAWTEYTYRANGKEESGISYYSNGSVSAEKEYDTNGNLIKDTWYSSDGNITGEVIYGTNGKKKSETHYYESGSISYLAEYDSDGRIASETNYDTDGIISTYAMFDSDGNMVKFHMFDINLVQDTEYEYDANGNTVRSVTYDQHGDVLYRSEYEIGEDGIMYCTSYDVDGNELFRTPQIANNDAKYDMEGYLVRKYVNGVSMSVEREYDGDGNVIRITVFDKFQKEIERYEYEYISIP